VRLDLTTTLATTASATVRGIAPATPFRRRKVFRETRLATHADAACASKTVRPRPGVPGKLDLSGCAGSFTKAPWASKNQASALLFLAEQGLWSVKASKVATWRESGAKTARPLRPHGVVLVFIVRKSSTELFLIRGLVPSQTTPAAARPAPAWTAPGAAWTGRRRTPGPPPAA